MEWNNASEHKVEWVEKFKDIFIHQDKKRLVELFSNQSFGIHNSLDLETYCEVEMEEFALKCEKFELNMSASVKVYDLPNDMFYFALGKKDDLAVFEGIFTWNNLNKIADGNGYKFKIEPKIQFIKNESNGTIDYTRRINIKPLNGVEIYKVIEKKVPESSELVKIELNDILGGNFYGYIRNEISNNLETKFEEIKIFSSEGIAKQHVLLRGTDHPLFMDNLWPEITKDKKEFKIKDNCWPVIIWVLLENGEEFFYKYPKEKQWNYENPIKEVCLTDNLSFDWIVKNG